MIRFLNDIDKVIAGRNLKKFLFQAAIFSLGQIGQEGKANHPFLRLITEALEMGIENLADSILESGQYKLLDVDGNQLLICWSWEPESTTQLGYLSITISGGLADQYPLTVAIMNRIIQTYNWGPPVITD